MSNCCGPPVTVKWTSVFSGSVYLAGTSIFSILTGWVPPPPPPAFPARRVRGLVLAGACRYQEFRVTAADDSGPRVRLAAEVVHTGRLRDFFGFNRAKHAVLEAAILATRTAFLPADEIAAEYRRLAVPVAKTGGPAEKEAFALLEAHIQKSKGSSRK